ncbi:hypothetical protein QFC21_003143 [Naganishia friedmannii]|uniref:Uncharacterized protein n=1 Tax=Naganishia friedmannii TaxID=89922 RepID=A0ACC2VS21_9TREE|nr:hypothetical protein QFC21_003143 [Naganishia friedmannii]
MTTDTSPTSNDSSKKDTTIAVVGGGIGGILTAIGLGKQGYTVHLFEQAAKFSEIGAGIAIGGNSFRALQMMGLGEDYAKVAGTLRNLIPFFRLASPVLTSYTSNPVDVAPPHHVWFDFVSWDTREKIGAPVSKPPYTNVHRARFLDEMLRHLPESVQVHFGSHLTYIENFDTSATADSSSVTTGLQEMSLSEDKADDARIHTQGRKRERGVRLYIDKPARDAHPDYPAEAQVFECDVCIGCDGVKSAVRKALALGGTVRYTGTYAYRGLLPMDKAVALCGEDVRVPKMWCGEQKHILTFPIDGGKTLNMVAFVSDRSRPENEREFHGPWVTPSSLGEMQRDFQGWDGMVVDLFPLIEKPEHWALHDLLPLDSWLRGRVALLGDASLPHNGAGAGQAIEDALLLSEIFKHPRCNADTAEDFLKVWEELYEFASEHGNDYTRMGQEMETRWNWIWDHDHAKDIERAYGLLKERGY